MTTEADQNAAGATGAQGATDNAKIETTALDGGETTAEGATALDGAPSTEKPAEVSVDYSGVEVPEGMTGHEALLNAAKEARVAPDAVKSILPLVHASQVEAVSAATAAAAEAAAKALADQDKAIAQAELAKLNADPQAAVLKDAARWALNHVVPKEIADVIRKHPALGNSLGMAKMLADIARQHREAHFPEGKSVETDNSQPWDRAYNR